MCGFFVYYPLNNKSKFNQKKFVKSGNYISHRGPDDKHSFYNQDIKMLFYRLKIIDLSNKGRQPMLSHSKENIIVFNGEIYNAKYLRSFLNQDYIKGSSDTEVLLNLYEKMGPSFLEKVEGMFSLVIYNFKKKNCFIARDRFGIKPLYFSKNKDYLLISSEIKPILSYDSNENEFNKEAFADFFFKQQMDHQNKSFFKNINSLNPATFQTVDRNKSVNKKYWNIEGKMCLENFSQAKAKFQNLFLNSLDDHLVSDKKISLMFSGGTDSTALAILMNRKLEYQLDTYTYDFAGNEKYGESANCKILANKLGIKNFTEWVEPKDVLKDFDDISFELESPFTSIRLCGVRKILKKIKNDGFNVTVEGGGGDEILGGYQYNHLNYLLDQVKTKNLKEFYEYLGSLIKKKNKQKILDFIMTITYQSGSTKDSVPFVDLKNFNNEFLDDFINENYYTKDKFSENLNFMQKSQYNDIKYVNLPRSLKYTDKLSMNSGIENRVPFLDHHLAKFSFNLPNNFKYKNKTNRYILKEMFKDQGFSKFFTKSKKSIVDPQREWLKNELKEFIFDTFNSSEFKNSYFFNQKNIVKSYNNFIKTKNHTSFGLFQILSAFRFQQKFSSSFTIK